MAMAIPIRALQRRMSWGKIGGKAREQARKAVQKYAQYRKGRQQVREIGALKKFLKIPTPSLKAHIEMLAKELENAGKTKNDIFEIVINDLNKMKQLATQTNTGSDVINKALLGNGFKSQKMTVSAVIKRMEQRAETGQ